MKRLLLFMLVSSMTACSQASAGSISLTVRNLDGTPVTDQANRLFTAIITTPAGIVTVERDARGRISNSNKSIAELAFTPPDASNPDRPTFVITIKPAAFAATPGNVAVSVSTSLSDRTSPGPITNVVATTDTTIHLAFPVIESHPDCGPCEAVYLPMSGGHHRGKRLHDR